ncbi:MAG: CrcB family protein [Actinomycetaceae bacterium]|nr:CrcB family protein [Actinomycetaceae bacterium]
MTVVDAVQEVLPTLIIWLCVALGGGLGAMSRYGLDRLVGHFVAKPGVGIATVNIIGCFIMGIVTALMSGSLLFIVATGFLGGFTTFSTAVVDVYQAILHRKHLHAILLLLGTYVLGIAAACAGVSAGYLFLAQ